MNRGRFANLSWHVRHDGGGALRGPAAQWPKGFPWAVSVSRKRRRYPTKMKRYLSGITLARGPPLEPGPAPETADRDARRGGPRSKTPHRAGAQAVTSGERRKGACVASFFLRLS